jgi:geranylgeranyl pyrophosphate synthase
MINLELGHDMTEGDFEEYLKTRATFVNSKIEEYLTKKSSDQYVEKLLGKAVYKYDNDAITKGILEPSWYLFSLGGKRWRPVLMLLMIEALGVDANNYVEFSIIPEVIHNATLIHDDIEDGSETRRGSPAVHVKFGLDVANNLGDFLYYFPVVALINSKKLNTKTKDKMLEIYAQEMLRVTTGQAVDIAWHRFLVNPFRIDEEEYLEMCYDKTGVLARMACRMAGTLCQVDDDTVEKLGIFGATVGVAFQIQDDVLNIYESGVSKSKGGVGDDISEGKITLMVIHVLKVAEERDKQRLTEILKMHTKDKPLIDEAINLIKKYKGREYVSDIQKKIIMDAWNRIEQKLKESEAKKHLKELVDFLISRSV